MSEQPTLTLYHWPHSRSATTLELLEELGAEYQLKLIDLGAGKQNEPDFLALNPMGKLPTLEADGAVITEQVAICIYLSDAFPQAGLTPAIADPLRGPWLRWLIFYAACFEPAMQDIAGKRTPGPKMSSPYGSPELVISTLRGHISQSPFIAGPRFTSADVLWSSALTFMTGFKLLEKTPDIAAYLARTGDRPARQRAAAINAKILAG